jgi:hypothetical protein
VFQGIEADRQLLPTLQACIRLPAGVVYAPPSYVAAYEPGLHCFLEDSVDKVQVLTIAAYAVQWCSLGEHMAAVLLLYGC